MCTLMTIVSLHNLLPKQILLEMSIYFLLNYSQQIATILVNQSLKIYIALKVVKRLSIRLEVYFSIQIGCLILNTQEGLGEDKGTNLIL